MDIVQIIQEKSFLGQEFLTWLWWMSEEDAAFKLADGREIGLILGERMSLAPIMGVPGSRVAMAGPDRQLSEARQGLKRGKMVDSLRLGIMIDNEEYWLSLDSHMLSPRAIRLPASVGMEDQETDADAQTLERIALLHNLQNALDSLFLEFLQQRLQYASSWPQMAQWIAG